MKVVEKNEKKRKKEKKKKKRRKKEEKNHFGEDLGQNLILKGEKDPPKLYGTYLGNFFLKIPV